MTIKKGMASCIAVLGCLAIFMTLGHAQKNPLEDGVDAIFAKWNKTNSPGCALSVMQNGHIIYERGYGMADLDHDIAITPGSVFHVASMSKQFTAASIVLLEQAGKLSLDDEVRKYVPEVPNFGVPITLRQLLHHTSGIRDQWGLLGLAGWRYSEDLITNDDVLGLISRQKDLNFPPGDKFLYSNTGFTLLGEVVKRVSGQTLREFTTTHIFQPLGMTHTHFRDDHAEIVKNMAFGYEPSGDTFREGNTDFDTVGATSLLTTVEDLALWDENFYNPRVGGKEMVEEMLQLGKLNDGKPILSGKAQYALGLEVGEYRGLPTVDHSGSDAGYRADLIRFPQQHFSVATLCNASGASPSQYTKDVADIYLADKMTPKVTPEKAPDKPQPAEFHVSKSELQEYAGDYVSPEIDLVYRIAMDKENLVLTRMKYPASVMHPTAKDEFRAAAKGAPGLTLRFTRDANGKLTGFLLDQSRVLNVRFNLKKKCD